MKHLLKMLDLSKEEILDILNLAASSNTRTKTVSSTTFSRAKLSE